MMTPEQKVSLIFSPAGTSSAAAGGPGSDRAGVAAERTAPVRGRPAHRQTRWRRSRRTSRPRPRTSSTCSWRAGPASSSCSTTSRSCESTTASRSRSRSSRASASRSWTPSRRMPKLLGTRRKFAQHGKSGAWVSECLPHIGDRGDDIAFVRSMATDVFNHAPAKMFMNTGSPQFGRPSMGSWVTYGIGSESQDLPGFVVLQSGPRGPRGGARSGERLPADAYQGVPFRSGGDRSSICDAGGHSPRDAQQQARRRGARPEPRAPGRHRRPGDRHAHRRLRDGLPDADQRAGADRSRPKSRADAGDVRRRSRQAIFREQLPAGAPAGRARRALRAALSHRLGPPRHGHRPSLSKKVCREVDQARPR